MAEWMWLPNKSMIGGGSRILVNPSSPVQNAVPLSQAPAAQQQKQEPVVQAASPMQQAVAPSVQKDVFGTVVPAGQKALPENVLVGSLAQFKDTAFINYKDNQPYGVTVQAPNDYSSPGGIGRTTFFSAADVKAEREKYYAGKADEQAFIASHPYGQSMATGGYQGFAAQPTQVKSQEIKLGGAAIPQPSALTVAKQVNPAIPFTDWSKSLDVYPGKQTTKYTNLPEGGYEKLVTTWSKPEVSYGGPFNTRAEQEAVVANEVKRMQTDPGLLLSSTTFSILRQPGEVLGAASMDLTSGFKNPALETLLAKENIERGNLIQEYGQTGGLLRYMGTSVFSTQGLPAQAVSQAALGAGFSAVSKAGGGLIAGTVAGKVVASTPVQVGAGAAWLYTGPSLPLIGPTSYKSVKEQAAAQGAGPEEAEQAGRSFLGSIVVGAPAAKAGYTWAQEASPVASGVRTVPRERPENVLEKAWNAATFKKTQGTVIDDVVVQRGVYNENTMKPYWESSRDYVKISKANPSLETRYAPSGAYNVQMWQDETFLNKLGTANKLSADVPMFQKAIANTLPRIKETQGVASAWNEGVPPRTKYLTPDEKYAGDVAVEARARFIQQSFGSEAGYGQQAPEFRTGRLAQYPGDKDVQGNWRTIISPESGSAVGRILYQILPQRGFMSRVTGDQMAITAEKFAAATGKGVVQGSKVTIPETGKSTFEGHPYGDAGVPDNVLGIKLQQPSIKVPGTRIPTSSLSQEAANTGARTLNVYRTPEGKIVIGAPPDKPTAYAQFYKNAVSSAQSAKAGGKITASEFDTRMASLEEWKAWAKKTYPESSEGFKAYERGTLKTELDAVKPPASTASASVFSGSAGASILSTVSGLSRTTTRGVSASSASRSTVSSIFSSSPPSSYPSKYASSYPPSSVPSYYPSSGGSSSSSSIYNYYSSSASSSSSSSVYNYYYNYSSPSSPGKYSFLGMPSPWGGSSGRGGRGQAVGGGRRTNKYTPSLAGLLSGRTVGRQPRSFSGIETRYPVASRRYTFRGKRR